MKVGITSFCLDRTIHPVKLAREAEARGFESLWYPEHSHIPASRRTPWPGGFNGEPLPDDYWRMHDMFNALSMAAAVTSTIRIGTGVMLIGQRDPIWTAKQVASLDYLSGGRLEIGIGFGWNREEQENHGYPWKNRREMVREKVEAMRELWTKEEASYHGKYVQFEPSWQLPKPIQKPYPPIYIGGGWGPVLFDHICQWADGWMPVSARTSLKERLDLLEEACERNGRDRSTLTVSVFGATTDPRGVENLAAEGVERIILTLPYEGEDVVMPLLDEWAPLVEIARQASPA